MKTKILLAVSIYTACVAILSVNVFGYDKQTTQFLADLDQRIVQAEQKASPTDRKAQQEVIALYGLKKGIAIDMAKCPLIKAQAGANRNYCQIWWSIKMRPNYIGIIYK